MNEQPPPGGWDTAGQLTEEQKEVSSKWGGKRKTRRRKRKRKTKKSRRKGRKTKKRRKRKTRKKRGRGKVDKKTMKKMKKAKAKVIPSTRKIKKVPLKRQPAFGSRVFRPVRRIPSGAAAASVFNMSDIRRALPQQQQQPLVIQSGDSDNSDNSITDAEVREIMNSGNEPGASKQ